MHSEEDGQEGKPSTLHKGPETISSNNDNDGSRNQQQERCRCTTLHEHDDDDVVSNDVENQQHQRNNNNNNGNAAAATEAETIPNNHRISRLEEDSSYPRTTTTTTAVNRRYQAAAIVRRKKGLDMTTGKVHECTCHCQPIFSDDDDDECYKPMDPGLRWWKQMTRCRSARQRKSERPHHRDNMTQHACVRQYRLTSQRKAHGFWSILNCAPEEEFQVARGLRFLISNYLHWTFRNSFLLLFLTVTFVYILGILVFAILIYLSGRHIPHCITIGSKDFDSSGRLFIDSVSLSWNSFSTVGYGATYPSFESQTGKPCVGINMLIAVESFAGIIFVGFVGAVVYSKVARIQSFANVEFSDPIVIRYGTGVMPVVEETNQDETLHHHDNDSDDDDDYHHHNHRTTAERRRSLELLALHHGKGQQRRQQLCPILEFRVVNRTHDEPGGEICNARIKVVASTLAKRASPCVRAELNLGKRASNRLFVDKDMDVVINFRASIIHQNGKDDGIMGVKESPEISPTSIATSFRKKGLQRASITQIEKLNAVPEYNKEVTSTGDLGSILESGLLTDEQQQHERGDKHLSSGGLPTSMVKTMPLPVAVVHEARQHVTVDEEPTHVLIPRLIFSTLNIESDEHPFFKRVWNIRHVLNEKSPLLSPTAKRMIEANDGYWPDEWNSYDKVRDHLHFHEIIATLSGTDNVSGSAVYAQKVYAYDDINVGYRFAHILYKTTTASPSEGNIGVDMDLLNDVIEQVGGGAEPLKQPPAPSTQHHRPRR